VGNDRTTTRGIFVGFPGGVCDRRGCLCGSRFAYVSGGCIMSDSLINRSACKALAIRWGQDHRRGWQPTRCSKQFLDDLDAKVRLIIQKAVDRHRTVGTTIKDLL
jgi:hypothetical protein